MTAKVPGWDWSWLLPDAPLLRASFSFSINVKLSISARLLFLICLVVPSKSRLDLREALILTINANLPNKAVPPIDLRISNVYGLAEDHARQVLLRYLTKGLAALRGINSLEADLVLSILCVEDRDRVAINDLHDSTRD